MESLIGRSLNISDYFESVMLHIFETLGTFPRKKKEGDILPSWMGGVAFDESMGEEIEATMRVLKLREKCFEKLYKKD